MKAEPEQYILDEFAYLWTGQLVADHVRELLSMRAVKPPTGFTAWLHDDAKVCNSVVRMVVEGCDKGPWEEMDMWEQETCVAIARRKALAMLG